MRERELKKECIDAAREMNQTQRGREGDEPERQRGREHRDKVSETKCEERCFGILSETGLK